MSQDARIARLERRVEALEQRLAALPGQFVTPREVADYLRTSTRTVYAMIERGDLHAARVGLRNIRIPLSELNTDRIAARKRAAERAAARR